MVQSYRRELVRDICKNCGGEIVWSSGGVYVGPECWRHQISGAVTCMGVSDTHAEPAKGAAVIAGER